MVGDYGFESFITIFVYFQKQIVHILYLYLKLIIFRAEATNIYKQITLSSGIKINLRYCIEYRIIITRCINVSWLRRVFRTVYVYNIRTGKKLEWRLYRRKSIDFFFFFKTPSMCLIDTYGCVIHNV